ncbi:hypothetical protein HDU79_010893 [Rhizoclosmatium sp. JEL0117]|nr:hypothetical protein HDU79_010893 [Rhizoclosmatium sp. JEL0117]
MLLKHTLSAKKQTNSSSKQMFSSNCADKTTMDFLSAVQDQPCFQPTLLELLYGFPLYPSNCVLEAPLNQYENGDLLETLQFPEHSQSPACSPLPSLTSSTTDLDIQDLLSFKPMDPQSFLAALNEFTTFSVETPSCSSNPNTAPTSPVSQTTYSSPASSAFEADETQDDQDSDDEYNSDVNSTTAPTKGSPSKKGSSALGVKKITSTKRGRDFVCKVCGSLFIRKQDMQRHEATHSEVKEHVCTIKGCGAGFVRRDALMRHMKSKRSHKKLLQLQ